MSLFSHSALPRRTHRWVLDAPWGGVGGVEQANLSPGVSLETLDLLNRRLFHPFLFFPFPFLQNAVFLFAAAFSGLSPVFLHGRLELQFPQIEDGAEVSAAFVFSHGGRVFDF